MPVSSRALVELILLGPSNDRRQLQDSPILGDVWIAFASKPAAALDLLITPHRGRPAGPVAVSIADRIGTLGLPRAKGEDANVAYLHGLVAARLFFREVLVAIVPLTKWWQERDIGGKLKETHDMLQSLKPSLDAVIAWATASNEDERAATVEKLGEFRALDRYIVLAGIILGAGRQAPVALAAGKGIGAFLSKLKKPEAILKELRTVIEQIKAEKNAVEPQVWQVSLNRKAMPALDRSVPAVKADAAHTLFNVKCSEIRWAVLDCGIDGTHPAFYDEQGHSRIVGAYNFADIRSILSLDNRNPDSDGFKERASRLAQERDLDESVVEDILRQLGKDAGNDRPVHWELVEKLIRIDPAKDTPPVGHGTHVAGIIGANGKGCIKRPDAGSTPPGDSGYRDGMCPDIKLIDMRVLAKSVSDTEFAIIAALQFVRYLNDRHSFISVHGVNLSLSIPHDVRNFACGCTPVCNECERLVENGVVVVAAAGNFGYHSYETQDGGYEGYTAFSITDPGNAEEVITVGATHRFWPHTYGVSFFSSRGPTGDGRLKPDLVAPGERVQSCLLNQGWGELDGTSMAAPHVSGAAAMLMARYSELIGRPREIKRLLCESATDLARDRSFQGHGMLDVLRAFQNI